MDKIDVLYYINLDYRSDRKIEFLEWIDKSGFPRKKVNRIDAVSTPGRGHVGCYLSHIKTLETFLASEHKTCIVFEDDYHPLKVDTFWSEVNLLFDCGKEFDLVMCSYGSLKSEPTDIPFLHKVTQSYTTSSFIITRDFAKILLDHINKGVSLLLEEEESTRQRCEKYKIDIYWMELMPVSRWFCFYPRLGIQRPSFSDIQMHHTDYQV